ncbi:hypothetical protein T492DRAFT_878951 [Pavlovales sp. CCMP2436]|nr:hypothetical protein T492DRAFT_878951 [Pavlovales sp. CCMP2436]
MAEAVEGVEKDLTLLVVALNRLGKPQPGGTKACIFIEVFRDKSLEQQLESLVGSLKPVASCWS